MDSEWLTDNFSSIRSVRECGKCQLCTSAYMRSLENSRNTREWGRNLKKDWSPKIVSRGRVIGRLFVAVIVILFLSHRRGKLGNQNNTYT